MGGMIHREKVKLTKEERGKGEERNVVGLFFLFFARNVGWTFFHYFGEGGGHKLEILHKDDDLVACAVAPCPLPHAAVNLGRMRCVRGKKKKKKKMIVNMHGAIFFRKTYFGGGNHD